MENNCAVILAAGAGKRMKSDKPKVLCEVLCKPMLGWVISSCEQAGIDQICAVTGHGRALVEDYLAGRCATAYQAEQLGTGHAVLCAEDFLKEHLDGDAVILCGDAPFMDSRTISQAHKAHAEQGNAVTVISAELDNPSGYGRIVRESGAVTGIVEQKDATPEQTAIREVNSGTYWFKVRDLLGILNEIKPNNSQGEYYLTDAVRLLLEQGKKVGAYTAETPDVVLGANDRKTLYRLNTIARETIIERHIENGVEFVCTDGVIIDPDVEIDCGATILPGTILKGKTKIEAHAVIGPNSLIEDSTIGQYSVINATQVYQSAVHDQVKIGPFCHIRPNSVIHTKVKIGDFVEVKNSVVGAGTAISHLTYVGDSDVGKNVNFGCGCVTVNYDGINKFRTTIEDGAFIGCNTNLVAPVTVGENAYTAAGSTITKDVPGGALGIGRAKQVNREGFADKKLAGRKTKV